MKKNTYFLLKSYIAQPVLLADIDLSKYIGFDRDRRIFCPTFADTKNYYFTEYNAGKVVTDLAKFAEGYT